MRGQNRLVKKWRIAAKILDIDDTVDCLGRKG